MTKNRHNRLNSVRFGQGSETKARVKPVCSGEVNAYDFCLLERAVTLECVQFQALMASENAQRSLNREQTVFVEDNNNSERKVA